MSVIAISFLTILFLLQIFLPKARLNNAGFLFLMTAIILVFGLAGFNSWQQYSAWQVDPAAKFLLPPYQDWNYFVFHARYNFFNPYLISLLMGVIFFLGAKKLNKKYDGRFFEEVEPYLLLISMFLLGTPGWLAYLFVFFAVYFLVNILITFYHLFINKNTGVRIPLFYLWIPVAISTIMISRWLAVLPAWQVLKF